VALKKAEEKDLGLMALLESLIALFCLAFLSIYSESLATISSRSLAELLGCGCAVLHGVKRKQ
jgi:hypothetical protein